MSKNIWISKDMGNGVRVGTNVSVASLFLGYGALVVLALVGVAGLWGYAYLFPDCKKEDIQCRQAEMAKEKNEQVKLNAANPYARYVQARNEVLAYEEAKGRYNQIVKRMVDGNNLNGSERDEIKEYERKAIISPNRDIEYSQHKKVIAEYEELEAEKNKKVQAIETVADQKRVEAYLNQQGGTTTKDNPEIMGPPIPEGIKWLPQQIQEGKAQKTHAVPEPKPIDQDKLNEDLYRG